MISGNITDPHFVKQKMASEKFTLILNLIINLNYLT